MDAFFEGLRLVTAWPTFGLLLAGVAVGLYLGAVPGLGGMVGFSLLIPLTFGMDPVAAFALLIAMYAVTTTSDTLSSVLLGVPGTAAGAATVVDGYPLSQQGQAMRALGAAFTSSAIGGVLGAFALALSIPIVKPLILSFAPPEFFMLGVLGLIFVSALSGKAVLKGILAALLGVMITTIGYSTQGGITRYSFEINYLLDGLHIVPVVLGLFAIPEIVDLATKGSSIAGNRADVSHRGQMWQGIRDALAHRWLVLRASIIGIYLGMMPGVGGSIADWVAYGHAVQGAKDRERFGKGDIRGVIAPEAANNSVKGGDLLPTVAFGVPGSAGMSILLGAFLIHGLRPGPEMLTTNLKVTFSMVWTLVIANIVGAAALMLWSRQLAKITFVRGHLIVPGIVLFAFMGAWMSGSTLGDWITLLVFGVIGVALRRGGWPRPPVVLGFVLGPIMETNLDLSYQALGWTWLGRPLVMAMIAILVVVLLIALWARWRRRQRPNPAPATAGGELGGGLDKRWSVPMDVALIVLFALALWWSRGWSQDASFFPRIVATCGLIAAGLSLLLDLVRRLPPPPAGAVPITRVLAMFGFFGAVVVLSLLFGQLIAIPVMTAAYLLGWARERWTMALAQAVGAWAVLYFLFDKGVHVMWQPPVLPLF